MSYCPEDGKLMVVIKEAMAFAEYQCPQCNTIWQYDAEQGCYRVINPEEQGND